MQLNLKEVWHIMIELKDIKQLVGMEYFSKSQNIQHKKESHQSISKNCVATNMITKINIIK